MTCKAAAIFYTALKTEGRARGQFVNTLIRERFAEQRCTESKTAAHCARTVAHALISYTQGAYEHFCRDGITQFTALKILCYILLRIMIDYIAVRIFLMTGIRYKKSWSKVWHVQNLEKRKDNYRIIRQKSQLFLPATLSVRGS